MSKEIDFNELKRELPYKWRVQSFSKTKPEATCVAYIDSRDAQKLLDEVVGPENWQDEYYEVKNNLFCKIGIRVNGEWTWKGDCGTESNVDKEKGEASDAFKRAAVKWGIGRFLYDLGMHKLPADKMAGGQGYPSVVDEQGRKVWDVSKHINNLNKNKKAAAAPVSTSTANPKPQPDPVKMQIAKDVMAEATAPKTPKPATTEQQELYKELLQDDKWTDKQREDALELLPSLNYDTIAQSIGKMQKYLKKAA